MHILYEKWTPCMKNAPLWKMHQRYEKFPPYMKMGISVEKCTPCMNKNAPHAWIKMHPMYENAHLIITNCKIHWRDSQPPLPRVGSKEATDSTASLGQSLHPCQGVRWSIRLCPYICVHLPSPPNDIHTRSAQTRGQWWFTEAIPTAASLPQSLLAGPGREPFIPAGQERA